MSSCGTCGADRKTIGVITVGVESRLCVECLKREGFGAPLSVFGVTEDKAAKREPKPRLPLRANKWEIRTDTLDDDKEVGPKGDGWWLIDVRPLMHPDTDTYAPHVKIVYVYARRKVVKGLSEGLSEP